MTYKIALVGTSCVGKTTLVDRFRQESWTKAGLVVVAEAARDYFTEHRDIPEPERFTVAVQGQIQLLAIEREREALSRPGVRLLLCDRSVLDAVVYTAAFGDIQGSERLLERITPLLPSYACFFLLEPSDIAFENDSVRQEDAEARKRVHDVFTATLRTLSLPFETLRGPIAIRAGRIEKEFANFGADRQGPR